MEETDGKEVEAEGNNTWRKRKMKVRINKGRKKREETRERR
jgi:hypothetical protein